MFHSVISKVEIPTSQNSTDEGLTCLSDGLTGHLVTEAWHTQLWLLSPPFSSYQIFLSPPLPPRHLCLNCVFLFFKHLSFQFLASGPRDILLSPLSFLSWWVGYGWWGIRSVREMWCVPTGRWALHLLAGLSQFQSCLSDFFGHPLLFKKILRAGVIIVSSL